MEVPNTQENMSKCICGRCPSYIQGDTGAFCMTGASDKGPSQKGCFCGGCEIWSEFSLSGEGYYCINGKAS